MIDEVMFSIRELSGQEYVDTYATKKAGGLADASRHVESPEVRHADALPIVRRRSNPTEAVAANQ